MHSDGLVSAENPQSNPYLGHAHDRAGDRDKSYVMQSSHANRRADRLWSHAHSRGKRIARGKNTQTQAATNPTLRSSKFIPSR